MKEKWKEWKGICVREHVVVTKKIRDFYESFLHKKPINMHHSSNHQK